MFRSMRGSVTGLIAAGFLAGSAVADVSGFLGNWLNSDAGRNGFIDRSVGPGTDDGEIARIVTTPAGANAIRIHLYGRCEPECDWGSQIGHNRMAGPASDDVRSISADFNTGKAVKHLTLRQGAGNSLRFEVATDFTDRTGKHDYEASGTLRSVPPPATVAAAPSAPAAVPGAIAAAPALEFAEDCGKINPEDIFVAPSERGWKLRDYNHVILDYGSDKAGALKAARVLEFYRIDEQCSVGRSKTKMIYWRVAGQILRDSMPGEDCVEVHPQTITAKEGQVTDGDRILFDFRDDTAAAVLAVSVLRTNRITRQCFVARPSDKMVYWLAK